MADKIKKYVALDRNGVQIAREGDEANPYLFDSLSQVFRFAHKINDNGEYVAIGELNIIEQLDSNH